MIESFVRDYTVVFFLAFLLSMMLTPVIRKRCQQRNIMDFPTDSRRVHSVPIPRLGGIAIYLAFFLPLFLILLTHGEAFDLFSQQINVLVSVFVASTCVFAVGVYDDIQGATVMQKLSVEVGAAMLLYTLGFKITLIAVPFSGPLRLGILELPVTILWLVGVTNALNFIDGIDGLACGVGFFSVSTMFILSLFLHHTLTSFFAAALAGAIFGFALYNFAPASIFMGDSGSLFIGFLIAAISLQGLQKSSTAVVLLIPVVALGVPITDTILAIIRRVGSGRSPFTADKDHIHHRLLRMGLSSRQVTVILYVVCLLLGITALLMTAVNNKVLTLILVMLSVIVIGGIKALGYTADMIRLNTLAKERIQHKKRVLRQQKMAEELLADIHAAVDMLTLQKAIIRYLEILEFDVGQIVSDQDAFLTLNWVSPRYLAREISDAQLSSLTIPLLVHHEHSAELRLGKYLSSQNSLLEFTVIVENLKYAIERSSSELLSPQSAV